MTWLTILAVGLAAVLSGARPFVAIGEWVSHQSAQSLACLGVVGAGPGESTIRRAFARIEADAFDQALGAYMWTKTTV
ncbi:MAG: transposase family protein, partial [Actinobacteria bacterium]|nr:transposase family protein [Actinomycetota bacterium]